MARGERNGRNNFLLSLPLQGIGVNLMPSEDGRVAAK
jgi:hypothetical protein